MIFFESCNSTKMKRTFNCHFGFAFTFFLKVAIQWKWKRLWTVILTLFSQPKPDCRSFLKVAIQWNEKDFQQPLKSRSDCPFVNDLFESCNSTKMKRTFSCHFDFAFTFFLKVAIQRKWKGLSTVILTLFSQPKPGWPFCRSFLKVAIQWKWKGLSTVILA